MHKISDLRLSAEELGKAAVGRGRWERTSRASPDSKPLTIKIKKVQSMLMANDSERKMMAKTKTYQQKER
jgi:hypothetical protein